MVFRNITHMDTLDVVVRSHTVHMRAVVVTMSPDAAREVANILNAYHGGFDDGLAKAIFIAAAAVDEAYEEPS